MEIVESDTRVSKTGSGEYVHLKMRVVDGPYEGRYLFDRLNYVNVNAQAQQIAQKSLKRLCRLCGVAGQLTNTEQLHFKRFHVSARIRKDAGYGEQNAVSYPDASDPKQAEPPAPAPVARPAPARPATTGAPKPWQKAAKS